MERHGYKCHEVFPSKTWVAEKDQQTEAQARQKEELELRLAKLVRGIHKTCSYLAACEKKWLTVSFSTLYSYLIFSY